MLMAIITFLPTEGKGAIAALDYTDEERKALAAKSVSPHVITPQIHEAMMCPCHALVPTG